MRSADSVNVALARRFFYLYVIVKLVPSVLRADGCAMTDPPFEPVIDIAALGKPPIGAVVPPIVA